MQTQLPSTTSITPPPRELKQIVTITLPASSRYLESLLQLQARIQLGLAIEELLSLLDVHGFSPRLIEPKGLDCREAVTLSVQIPQHLPQLITCITTRISLH